MRICLLLMVGVHAVSAEYLSDNGRNSLSSDPNKEDKTNQVDPREKNQAEIQKQLKHYAKEGRKHEEEIRKYQERFSVEKKLTKKKQLEKQTLKKWKRTEKEKLEETERKHKERQSRIETILNRLEKDSNKKRKPVSLKRSGNYYYDDYDNHVDHANWKNYVYKKYGLTELSGSVEKKSVLIRYVEEVLHDPNGKGTEAPAIRDFVSALESTGLVASTAAPVVASTAPVVPIAPESTVAAETSTARWPAATPDNIYEDPYLFPSPHSDFRY